MKKLLMVTHWLTTLLLNAAMVGGFYLYFLDGRTPIEFTNLPFAVEKQEYKRGEAITIEIKYCKKEILSSTMFAYFVDGIIFEMPSYETNGVLPVGCGTGRYQIVIPETLPAGEYQLRGSNVYNVNFLRQRTVEWYTQKFTVVE